MYWPFEEVQGQAVLEAMQEPPCEFETRAGLSAKRCLTHRDVVEDYRLLCDVAMEMAVANWPRKTMAEIVHDEACFAPGGPGQCATCKGGKARACPRCGVGFVTQQHEAEHMAEPCKTMEVEPCYECGKPSKPHHTMDGDGTGAWCGETACGVAYTERMNALRCNPDGAA